MDFKVNILWPFVVSAVLGLFIYMLQFLLQPKTYWLSSLISGTVIFMLMVGLVALGHNNHKPNA